MNHEPETLQLAEQLETIYTSQYSLPHMAATTIRQPLTEEQIIAIANNARAAESGDAGYILPIAFARAIEAAIAKQPARQPLTEDQLRDALHQCPHDTTENLRVRWLYAKDFARAVEAAHGIT